AINSFKEFKINHNVSVIQYENNLRNITHKEFYSENSRNQYYILQDKLNASGWDIVDDLKSKLKEKLHRGSKPLGAYVKMGQGIKAGLNDVFIIEDRFAKENKLEISLLRQYVKTKDIQRYNIKIRPIKLLLTLNDTPID